MFNTLYRHELENMTSQNFNEIVDKTKENNDKTSMKAMYDQHTNMKTSNQTQENQWSLTEQ